METKKATIKREDQETSMVLELGENSAKIILTDDNPNNIKLAFNQIIKELKKGLFQFELEDDNSDLYNNICVEYLIQLNSEIKAIHTELKEYELTVDE